MVRNYSVHYTPFIQLGRLSMHTLLSGLIHRHYYPVAGPRNHVKPSSLQSVAESTSRLFCSAGIIHIQKDGEAI